MKLLLLYLLIFLKLLLLAQSNTLLKQNADSKTPMVRLARFQLTEHSTNESPVQKREAKEEQQIYEPQFFDDQKPNILIASPTFSSLSKEQMENNYEQSQNLKQSKDHRYLAQSQIQKQSNQQNKTNQTQKIKLKGSVEQQTQNLNGTSNPDQNIPNSPSSTYYVPMPELQIRTPSNFWQWQQTHQFLIALYIVIGVSIPYLIIAFFINKYARPYGFLNKKKNREIEDSSLNLEQTYNFSRQEPYLENYSSSREVLELRE